MSKRLRMRLRALLPNIHGINLVRAKQFWLILGGTCRKGRMNGEEYFEHPAFSGPYKCGRGKSCPTELCRRLRVLILLAL